MFRVGFRSNKQPLAKGSSRWIVRKTPVGMRGVGNWNSSLDENIGCRPERKGGKGKKPSEWGRREEGSGVGKLRE